MRGCAGGLGMGSAAAVARPARADGAVSASVAVHRVWGDACVVAGDGTVTLVSVGALEGSVG